MKTPVREPLPCPRRSTTGNQTYTGNVTLSTGAVTLTGATPTFGGTIVGGGQDLTLNFLGTTALNGANHTGIAALTTGGGGTTTLTGTITTSGAQTYNDSVTLAGDTTLTSTSNAAITFTSTIDDPTLIASNSLTITGTSPVTFGGAVGTVFPIDGLTTGGSTLINGGFISAAGFQSYGGLATLGANTVIRTGPATFSGGLAGGGFDLTLDLSAASTFVGANFTGIRNLTIGRNGQSNPTTLSGAVTTSGTQTYDDPIILGANTTLVSTGSGSAGNITFNSTVNASTGGTETLTVNTSGTTTFGGAIGLGSNGVYEAGGGDDKYLSALTTDAGGGTTISGGTIFAEGITFNDTVTLGTGTVILGSGTHEFMATSAILGGGNSLTLSGGGTTRIGGNVSGLSTLTSDGGGTTTFGLAAGAVAVTVTTTGFQVYKDAIVLDQTTTLTGTSVTSFTTTISAPGTMSIATGVNGSKNLTVNITP